MYLLFPTSSPPPGPPRPTAANTTTNTTSYHAAAGTEGEGGVAPCASSPPVSPPVHRQLRLRIPTSASLASTRGPYIRRPPLRWFSLFHSAFFLRYAPQTNCSTRRLRAAVYCNWFGGRPKKRKSNGTSQTTGGEAFRYKAHEAVDCSNRVPKSARASARRHRARCKYWASCPERLCR